MELVKEIFAYGLQQILDLLETYRNFVSYKLLYLQAASSSSNLLKIWKS